MCHEVVFGAERTNITTPNAPNTDYGYTGQRNLDSGMGGLTCATKWYGLLRSTPQRSGVGKARFYSPLLGRFTQPDTLIPDPTNPQAFNRFSYTLGNPIKYNDPKGHSVDCGLGDAYCMAGEYTPAALLKLDRQQNGTRCGAGSIDSRCAARNNSLMNDIEAYMKKHPEYIPNQDPLFYDGYGIGLYSGFIDYRLQYWKSRTDGDTNEAYNLFRYHDLHDTKRVSVV